MQSLRIGIDCRLAGRHHAGIGRYVENLVTRLPGLAPSVQWVLFFHDTKQASEVLGATQPSNVEVQLVSVRHYSLAEQLQVPGIFGRAKLDLLHVPHFNIPLFYQGKIVVTIHDLLWHEYTGLNMTTLPKWQYWLKHLMYKVVVGQAVRRATKIFVPAQTIKKTVLYYYPEAQEKVVVTTEGVSAVFTPPSPTKLKAQARSRELLYVGSLYPHKNLKVVIDALPGLPGYTLNVVGTRNVFQDQVKQYVAAKKLSDRVKFLGYVADDQLTKLYQNAFALVQPSLSEGFGLTGIEAMASGVAVIASDIPIFHEVYQDAATYFAPQSSLEFAQAVQNLASADRTALLNKAQQVVTQYSWDQMAHRTLTEYTKILHVKNT